ncbi:Phosphatidylinositol-glycan biosynthesis class S protein [Cordyceps fumosorosea ARSEF 2679]|uniref:Phosphatidylinositol-glycan biosynthesis class S protein n=1 Tax=Cordyceps fumosorosea (strain ARSEF 2679) TaxID=1081104 RepID=A0A168ED61_CORFA|nr:Phosphatidylinositol-glycan biosynthesis class S protein [Cordyceps fumosorosea ARSEF 2679]OAA73671.1 Phosphatidylinositol-glycan biosynthesis class S protein [Cordyceps fumosorosea ARSEF 2679]
MASKASAEASALPAAEEEKGYTPPPPEKPSDTRRRSYIVWSYWLIVIFLGLPIWWQTTAIHRANLPLDSMMQWADGKACRPVFPLQIDIRVDALQEPEAQHLVRLTQHALDDLNEFSGHHLRLRLAPKEGAAADAADEAEPALTIHCRPGDAATSTLSSEQPVLDITYPPGAAPQLSSASSGLAALITSELRATFAEEQSIIAYLLSMSSMAGGGAAPTPEAAEALARRTTRSLRYAPAYHLTFSLFTDRALPNAWDVDRALDEHIRPMLAALAPIHNFTIDTQVQLYATPGDQSEVLSREALSSFINAAEWPLSPSIGGAPTVNFVLYVGNQTIRLDEDAEADAAGGSTSQSWTIPQWGSVYLLALPSTEAHVSAATLRRPMLTFGGHLLSLLGTPSSGSLPLRLSSLTRIRSTDLLLRASSSLGSLARLTGKLPSIAIPQSVADGVETTLRHLERACADLGGAEGLAHARVAEREAERAFFEKSMVGQLYFPDEHKIAVYLPLLGPISVPLVMGLVAEVKNWIARRRKRAEEAKGKKTQ